MEPPGCQVCVADDGLGKGLGYARPCFIPESVVCCGRGDVQGGRVSTSWLLQEVAVLDHLFGD